MLDNKKINCSHNVEAVLMAANTKFNFSNKKKMFSVLEFNYIDLFISTIEYMASCNALDI